MTTISDAISDEDLTVFLDGKAGPDLYARLMVTLQSDSAWPRERRPLTWHAPR